MTPVDAIGCMKAQAAALSHKSDAGGVVLNLQDREAVRAGWERMHADLLSHAPGLVLDGVLVEAMAKPGGTELIVGARRDPDCGPVVLVALGGVWAEALHDTRLLPPGLSPEEAEAELHKLEGAALLRGFRGHAVLRQRLRRVLPWQRRCSGLRARCPLTRRCAS